MDLINCNMYTVKIKDGRDITDGPCKGSERHDN